MQNPVQNETPVGFDVSPFSPAGAVERELRDYFDLTNEMIKELEPTASALEYEAYVAELRRPLTYRGPRACWVARSGGRIVGSAEVTFLEHENDRFAQISVRVTRRLRRNGVGRALLVACLAAARGAGREVVVGYNLEDDSAGLEWARGLGFAVVKRTVWQTLDVAATDSALWRVCLDESFRLERWVDIAPESLVAGFAAARTAIEDAPAGESSVHAPNWTVERVRGYEAELKEIGEEHWYIVAVSAETGEVAGFTEIAFDPSLPATCFQEDTAVLARYRGRGLGRAVKAEMMQWLRANRPNISEVRTTTSADNVPMIRVNEQLGYVTTAMLHAVEIGAAELDRRLRGSES